MTQPEDALAVRALRGRRRRGLWRRSSLSRAGCLHAVSFPHVTAKAILRGLKRNANRDVIRCVPTLSYWRRRRVEHGRRHRGWAQTHLAVHARTSQRVVPLIERRRLTPTLAFVVRRAWTLGIDEDIVPLSGAITPKRRRLCPGPHDPSVIRFGSSISRLIPTTPIGAPTAGARRSNGRCAPSEDGGGRETANSVG